MFKPSHVIRTIIPPNMYGEHLGPELALTMRGRDWMDTTQNIAGKCWGYTVHTYIEATKDCACLTYPGLKSVKVVKILINQIHNPHVLGGK